MSSDKHECAGNCAPEDCCGDEPDDCQCGSETTNIAPATASTAEKSVSNGYNRSDCEWSVECAERKCPSGIDPDDIPAINEVTEGEGSSFDSLGFHNILSELSDGADLSTVSTLAKEYGFNRMRVWALLEFIRRDENDKIIKALRSDADGILNASNNCRLFEANLASAEVCKK